MIYLDNAATSFPKPRGVMTEMARCMNRYGGNPGHASHKLAMEAAEKIFECRELAAKLFDGEAERVVFTMNTTMAINTVIKGVLHKKDHVLISDMEHNAVFRPVAKLAKEGIITYDVFPTFPTDAKRSEEQILQGIEKLVNPNTRLLICAHASNICASRLPISKIGAFCRSHGIIFAVDGAQSAGHIPLSMKKDFIDALCLPGHKGLMGPMGCGMLILGEGFAADTLMEGGSGFQSLDWRMPEESPERFEAGTLPTPCIAGLSEGLRFVSRVGVENIEKREAALTEALFFGLQSVNGIRLTDTHQSGNLLLFHSEKIPADEFGNLLNEKGFCVRTGFHCSALGHQTLKTPDTGAVRVSPGYFTTLSELALFADAVEKIIRETV